MRETAQQRAVQEGPALLHLHYPFAQVEHRDHHHAVATSPHSGRHALERFVELLYSSRSRSALTREAKIRIKHNVVGGLDVVNGKIAHEVDRKVLRIEAVFPRLKEIHLRISRELCGGKEFVHDSFLPKRRDVDHKDERTRVKRTRISYPFQLSIISGIMCKRR